MSCDSLGPVSGPYWKAGLSEWASHLRMGCSSAVLAKRDLMSATQLLLNFLEDTFLKETGEINSNIFIYPNISKMLSSQYGIGVKKLLMIHGTFLFSY